MKAKCKIIGITGSIATGKSFICNLLIQKNMRIFDSDVEIGKLLSDITIIKEIEKTFKEAVRDNLLDKKILANIVFSDKKNLNKLESLLYPYLNKKIDIFIKKNQNLDLIFIDIPLLFEKKYDHLFDYIITATCASYIQEIRSLKRKNIDSEKLKNIIKNQYSDAKKKSRADFVINTGGSKSRSVRQLNEIIKIISSRL